MARERIDKLLVERGMVRSRKRARARIMAGDVRIRDQVVDKAGTKVDREAEIELVGDEMPYVSRGGLKLEQALNTFDVTVEDQVCMDIGASTGGFTDCLLQRGAKYVYAVDVGYGQLAWKLRQDDRVEVHERTNIRYLEEEKVTEPVDLVVVDCSFIGLDKVLPHARRFLATDGEVVTLVKPQFEAGPERVGKGGIVRDMDVRREVIEEVKNAIRTLGFEPVEGVDCDTHGPGGNIEYLMHLRLR